MGIFVGIFVAFALFALSGCISSQYDETDRRRAMDVMIACFQKRVPTLDDQTSDASSIALAIAASCSMAVEQCRNAYDPSVTYENRLEFSHRFNRTAEKLALEVVLAERVAK